MVLTSKICGAFRISPPRDVLKWRVGHNNAASTPNSFNNSKEIFLQSIYPYTTLSLSLSLKFLFDRVFACWEEASERRWQRDRVSTISAPLYDPPPRTTRELTLLSLNYPHIALVLASWTRGINVISKITITRHVWMPIPLQVGKPSARNFTFRYRTIYRLSPVIKICKSHSLLLFSRLCVFSSSHHGQLRLLTTKP